MSESPTRDGPIGLRPASQIVPRPVDWLWPGRLPLGKLAILDGDPGVGKSLATSIWRKKPESPRSEDVQGRLVKLGEQYHHLELLCNAHEPCDLPFHAGLANRFGYPQAEKLALQFRQLLGLGERPGQSLLRVLEEVCKIKVFQLDFEPSGSAACTLSGSFGAAILLNAKNVRWRRNFDSAHELFHLLTWKTFRSA